MDHPKLTLTGRSGLRMSGKIRLKTRNGGMLVNELCLVLAM
jgi:hypothetical protein